MLDGPNAEVLLGSVALALVAAMWAYWWAQRRVGHLRAAGVALGFELLVGSLVFIQFTWVPLLLVGGVLPAVLASIGLGLVAVRWYLGD
ncbi:MAG: hypothetical protein OXE50_00335 [Chloroflexi bacterium]|nr:hypothetical protein [Chloroflexota bacterium]